MANDPVLLVDPDPSFLRCVQRVFDAAGLDLDTASTGEEALIMLTTTPYGVVVAATNLTDMSPQRFFSRVSRLRPDTESVALVATRDTALAIDLYEQGNLFNHLWKPIDEIGDLTRQVGRAFERRALKQHNAYLLTELREAREELHQQADFLVQVEKLAVLGHSVRDLATEIAEPLQEVANAAAYLQTALVKHAPDTAASKRAAHLQHLVSEMRESLASCLERVESVSGFCEDRPVPDSATDLEGVVAESVGLLRHAVEERGIELRVDLASDLPPIRASRPEVRQALTHVIVNAIQAMPKGGVLGLSTELAGSRCDSVRLTIKDTGPGIPPSCLPHIFEPFYTTRPAGEGSGLGLHIARSVIHRHGGDIRIETEQGAGTTVRISLPVDRAAHSDSAAHAVCAA